MGPEIQSGSFTDSLSLWSNPDLVVGGPFDGRSSLVISPDRVNLLTTAIFYDRAFFHFVSYDDKFEPINDEQSFRRRYRFPPEDILTLIEAGKVVPILELDTSKYSDYILEKFMFPLTTNGLPHLTYEGHGLICQTWQVEFEALPDPKKPEWGFLMDLAGAMGIGANLVRPEFKSDIWHRHKIIFDLLGFEEIARNFISEDITLEDFFVASEIDYDSSMELSEYLDAFEQIDKDKLFHLYTKLNKREFYAEIGQVNRVIREHSDNIDQKHRSRKVLTAPVVFIFYLWTSILTKLLPAADAIEKVAGKELEQLVKRLKSRFEDALDERWSAASPFFKESRLPEAVELVKLKRVLGPRKQRRLRL